MSALRVSAKIGARAERHIGWRVDTRRQRGTVTELSLAVVSC